MALGAVVGAALTDHSARAYALWIDGLDVIRKPGSTGNSYGTPIDTVIVKENAPGSVSQLTATIDDPLGELSFVGNAVVMLQDLTNDWTRFVGFLTAWTPEPWAPSGRSISIVATGIEVVLDWAKVGPADITIAAGTYTPAAIQSLMSFLPNGTAMPLRVLANDPGSGVNDGSQALPLGTVGLATVDPATDLTIRAGTTLREAIRAIQDDSIMNGAALPVICTVDFYAGLRLWRDNYPGVTLPGGYGFLGVNDFADNAKAVGLRHTTDAGGSPTAVTVIGTGVTVTVGRGSAGETAVLADTTITTVQRATSFGLAYLARFRATERGEFDLEDMDPAITTTTVGDWARGIKEVHPGSALSIAETAVGLVASTSRNIGSMEHRFYGTKENVHVSYGGPVPSGAALLRRLTRTTLS